MNKFWKLVDKETRKEARDFIKRIISGKIRKINPYKHLKGV